MEKLLAFISFPLCIDIQIGFKTHCQSEHKEFSICIDKKKILAERCCCCCCLLYFE